MFVDVLTGFQDLQDLFNKDHIQNYPYGNPLGVISFSQDTFQQSHSPYTLISCMNGFSSVS